MKRWQHTGQVPDNRRLYVNIFFVLFRILIEVLIFLINRVFIIKK
jgi:hypothetical protein